MIYLLGESCLQEPSVSYALILEVDISRMHKKIASGTIILADCNDVRL